MAKRRQGRDDETRGTLSREEAELFREQAGEVRPIRQPRAPPRSAPPPVRDVVKRSRPSAAPEPKTTKEADLPVSAAPPSSGTSAGDATGGNDDATNFQQMMAGTRKLTQTERAPPVRSRRPEPRPTRPKQSPREPSPGYEAEADTIGAGTLLSYRGTGIQHREWQRFQRGKLKIEASLDLHGLPSADADRRTTTFIADARAQGLRCVCIVHGKGHSSADGQPILKRMVDRSLRHSGDVLAFRTAPDNRGGTGAVNVLLRKKADDS